MATVRLICILHTLLLVFFCLINNSFQQNGKRRRFFPWNEWKNERVNTPAAIGHWSFAVVIQYAQAKLALQNGRPGIGDELNANIPPSDE
jgi:hypothetical protein